MTMQNNDEANMERLLNLVLDYASWDEVSASIATLTGSDEIPDGFKLEKSPGKVRLTFPRDGKLVTLEASKPDGYNVVPFSKE
jgi:hypothetical protein